MQLSVQQRRINKRHRTPWLMPVTAVLASVAVFGAAAFGSNSILKTQEFGAGPISASVSEVSFGDGHNTVVDDPAIATQGEGGGPRAVKEFHRDEPFSQFALTWTGERDVVAFVRAKQPDGSWSEWFAADPIGTADNTGTKTGTELIYVGRTTDVQVSVGNVDLFADAPDGAAPADAAGASRTLPSDLDVVFIDGKPQDGIAPMADLRSANAPAIVSRAGWGANEATRCQQPTYDNNIQALTLHHTAGANGYSKAEAAGIVRGIYEYHARTLGWCDIGYNVLVDRFGTIYEGRFGGLDRNVQGAHVGGFNANNWGISMMGNYSTAQPSQAMLDSVAEVAGWRAAVAGIDPAGTTSLRSGGFGGSKYAAGTYYTGPTFMGHGDLHNTECPGRNTLPHWPEIRRKASMKAQAVANGHGKPLTLTQAPGGTAPGANAPSAPGTPRIPGGVPGTPGAPAAPDAVTSSLGSKEIPASTIQAVVGIAAALAGIAVAANHGGEAGKTLDPDKRVMGGLTVGEVPTIISKVVTLTGNEGLSQTWTAVLNGFGPLLGLPIGGPDLAGIDRNVLYQLFSNGVVLSSKDTGTHALVGDVAKAWMKNPEKLGLPTSDQYSVNGTTLRVDFQGGHITVDPASGDVNVFAD
ncbi:N-acetylmuramoyl-L-alanine amidase [Corynebacterium lizhenjunii]|uniref:N-acetylmuramoyl-L-alanine amidase n=1 Tax=Corynebacterium lizhenjunii TaxID=2709394 RepID=UPI001F46DFA2|nr:N-acetylmuramoyl-L-alanine amidase [Corynebacterium lizhenjunii]